MVTLKQKTSTDANQPTTKGVNQMELMIVLAGAMSMMVVSLAFQQAAYRKVAIKTGK